MSQVGIQIRVFFLCNFEYLIFLNGLFLQIILIMPLLCTLMHCLFKFCLISEYIYFRVHACCIGDFSLFNACHSSNNCPSAGFNSGANVVCWSVNVGTKLFPLINFYNCIWSVIKIVIVFIRIYNVNIFFLTSWWLYWLHLLNFHIIYMTKFALFIFSLFLSSTRGYFIIGLLAVE
jgi:hypothetical protein